MDFHFYLNQTRDAYDWLVFVCSLVLAFVGIGGVIVAVCTLKKVELQTEATKDAANAARDSAEGARLNAQAVINAERGRLLFEIEKRQDATFPGVGVFSVFAVNYGRVPAQILGYAPYRQDIVNFPKDLPVPPLYEPLTVPSRRFLAPNGKCLIAEATPAQGMTEDAVRLAESGGISINDQSRIIYGYVSYMDGISDEVRFSRYCYRLDKSQFRVIGGSLIPEGPPEYNEST
jgi:hypothetical protein